MVFYESPHRLAEMLTAVRDALGGDRRAAVCRELTKLHEEVLRDDLDGLVAWATGNQVRGEIVVVVHGAAPAPAPEPEDLEFTLAVADTLAEWIDRHKIEVLNVAGQSASKNERIHAATFAVIDSLLRRHTTTNR